MNGLSYCGTGVLLAMLVAAGVAQAERTGSGPGDPNAARGSRNVIHIDATSPDGGDGSAESPLNAMTDLPGVIESGDTVRVAGTFHNQPIAISGVDGVTIKQWGGRPQAVLRGDVPIESWQHVEGDVHVVELDPGLAVSSVTWRWDENVLDDGRHYGHLRPAESADDVAAEPAHFYYDEQSGDLLLNTAGLTDEPTDYTWCDGSDGAGHNALRISGGSGHLIDGLHTYLWIAPFGYGIYMSDVSDSTVANVICKDTGKHAIGWVGNSTNVNNTTINCESWGNTRDGASGATNFVYYVGSGTLDGGEVIDCTAHLYTRLDVHGEQIEPGSMTGFFAHTGFFGSTANMLHKRCVAIGYGEGNIRDFSVPTDLAPGDPWDGGTYHSRFVECESHSVARTGGAGNVAYIRSSLNPGTIQAYGTAPTLFEACDIVADVGGGDSVFVGSTDNSPQWHCLNTSILARGDEVSRRIIHMRNDATFSARGSIFAFAEEQGLTYFVRGPGAAPEQFDVEHCAYLNVDEMAFDSSWADPDSWMDLVDPHAVWLDDDPFADMTGETDLRLAPAGPLWSLKTILEIAVEVGINGNPYDGSYGSHQYGGLQADLTGDGVVGGADLGILLSQWGPCSDCNACPADLTGDCNVSGADLGILLSEWTN